MSHPALALSSVIALMTVADAAAGRGPSTKSERTRAVEITRRLERDPLGAGASKDRRWLIQWILEIPDIEVPECPGPLDVLKEDGGRRHGRILYAQSAFGIAAFLIKHPHEKSDWLEVQLAGIESVLKAYRSLLAAEPDGHWTELDLLLETQREGKLGDVIEETMEGCGDERVPGQGAT